MKVLNYIFSALFFLLVLTQCITNTDDLLDKEDVGDITYDMVFTDAQNSFNLLSGIYAEMPSDLFMFGNAGFLGNGIDEGHPKANWDQAYSYGIGDWGPTNLPINLNPWNKYYSAIRTANMFLDNVDSIPDASQPQMNEEIRQRMKGEVIFLRALFYGELLKYYGGVPIIETVLVPDSEELFQPRANYDELVDFVVSEAERAKELLPFEYSSSSDFGRATKGAALALISRVKLFAASPQFNNPSSSADTPWSGTYDQNKWIEAAEAARNFLEETDGIYQLHYSTSPTTLGNNEDFFTKRYSPEVILSYQYQPTVNNDIANVERFTVPGRFWGGGTGVINNLPLLNLVADYEIVELDDEGDVLGTHLLGLDKVLQAYQTGQVDPETGFDPQSPYENRDPRFYQDIYYQGVNWPARSGLTFEVWRDENDNNVTGGDWLSGWYNTGFFHRKLANPWANISGWGTRLQEAHNYPIFRYAEILLNYAESVNEAFGNPDAAPAGYPMSAREAVNLIRDRAAFPEYDVARIIPPGMPEAAKGKSLPPLPAGLSKDEMRDRIRHERRIELSWENHRFWDLRRWRMPDDPEVLNNILDIYAQRVYKQEDGTFRYDVERFTRRVWEDKHYLFPIMEIELRKNRELVQNPGW